MRAIVVTYALEGAKPSPPPILTSSPVSFDARLPACAEDVEHFVSASSLQLTEQFSRGLKGMKAGNAVTRTVTVSATTPSRSIFHARFAPAAAATRGRATGQRWIGSIV